MISAPSGAGKSTIIERIRPLFPDMLYSISCTTRSPRDGEREGVHYYFVERERFHEMVRNNEFLEWREVHTNMYGTPAAPVNRALANRRRMILDIDVHGAVQVFEKVRASVGIFVTVRDMSVLENRLRSRAADTEESIRIRLRNAAAEIELGRTFQYQIVNHVLEEAVEEMASIIRKESAARGLSCNTNPS